MHLPYGLVHFCWSLKNLLVLIYSKLHSKSCDYLYKVRQLFGYKGRQVLLQSATGITKCNDFISKCNRTMVTSTLGLIPRFECRKLEPALTVSRTVSLNAKEQGHGSSQVFIRVSLLSFTDSYGL